MQNRTLQLINVSEIHFMKSIYLLSLTLLLAANQLVAQKIKIKGSDTMLPLTQQLAEEFMKRNIDASVSTSGGGSLHGISALVAGTTDIAQSARELSAEEKKHLKEAGINFTETIIAYDALAVIIHPSNKVSKLTIKQLEDIFDGIITNWKEVGGADKKIVLYSRGTSSGTYDFFREHVLSNKPFAQTAILLPATGAIAQSVSQTEGGIGYVGLAYLDKTVKAVQISGDNGKTYAAPSAETVKDKTYPISRPLYYIYPDNLKETISPFIEYVTSYSGQNIVMKSGYVTVK